MSFETDQKKAQQRLKDFSLIMKDLLKVIKVVAMYPEGNPLPQSLRRTFAERLEYLMEQYGETRIAVHKEHLDLDGTTVFTDKSKEESLAGLFFETGVTALIFKEGLDVLEIFRLLDVIKAYVNLPGKDKDLVAMIWESHISRFAVITIEDIALSEYEGEINISEFMHGSGQGFGSLSSDLKDGQSYDTIFIDPAAIAASGSVDLHNAGVVGNAPTGAGLEQSSYTGEDASGCSVLDVPGLDGAQLQAASEAMGYSDIKSTGLPEPDTTLILNDELRLSDEQEDYIAKLRSDDAEFDMWESTAELIEEMLLQEADLSQFNETVTVAEKVLLDFLRGGKLVHAGRLLAYFNQLEEKLRSDRALWAERLKDARITAGSRDRLKQLCEALNEHSQIGKGELDRYLDHFGWEALAGLTELMGELTHDHHLEALTDFLAERGSENTHLVARGISDKKLHVVRNSITIMSRIGSDKAIGYLKKVVSHPDRQVRLTLVRSLADSSSEEALPLLSKCVADKDAEIRTEAVRSIVARRGPAAFETITDIINDDSFAELDHADQSQILMAFSVLGGDAAVEYLLTLVRRYNPFRDSTVMFLRSAAFDALSNNRSDRCERALLKLASSIRPDIRRQAVEALRHRRDLIYGGDDD